MIEIEEMRREEMKELLRKVGYGHLGCSRDDQPYVVPVHYAYKEPFVYVYTTEGKKAEMASYRSNFRTRGIFAVGGCNHRVLRNR